MFNFSERYLMQHLTEENVCQWRGLILWCSQNIVYFRYQISLILLLKYQIFLSNSLIDLTINTTIPTTLQNPEIEILALGQVSVQPVTAASVRLLLTYHNIINTLKDICPKADIIRNPPA
jgi:hypothetical protein